MIAVFRAQKPIPERFVLVISETIHSDGKIAPIASESFPSEFFFYEQNIDKRNRLQQNEEKYGDDGK